MQTKIDLHNFQDYSIIKPPTRLIDITANPLVALFFAVEKDSKNMRQLFFYAIDEKDVKYQFGHTAILKSTVNWISQDVVSNFLEYGNKLKQNNSHDFKHKDSEVENFLTTLNQQSKISDKFDKPEAIYESLTSAQFVDFVRESDRMQGQQGSFIMPAHIAKDSKKEYGDNRENKNDFYDEDEEKNKIINDSILKSIESNNQDKGYEKFYIDSKSAKSIKDYLSIIGINEGTIYPDIEHHAKYLIDYYDKK